MVNPFETGERLRLAANNDGTYKKLAVEAANQKLRNRPPLNFKWMVLGSYGLFFAVALTVCYARKYTLFGIQMAPVTSFGLLLLIAGLIAYQISKRFLYRIERLITLTQRIAKGDLADI